MSANTEIKVDVRLIEEKKKFVKAIERMTTLKREEIIALSKIYGLGGFFEKYDRRIIEKQLGSQMANIVLCILRLKKCQAAYKEIINKSANDNPRLTAALRNWILNDEPKTLDEGSHNKADPCPEPQEVIEQEECLADMVDGNE